MIVIENSHLVARERVQNRTLPTIVWLDVNSRSSSLSTEVRVGLLVFVLVSVWVLASFENRRLRAVDRAAQLANQTHNASDGDGDDRACCLSRRFAQRQRRV
jgi:hypothetical protein